MSGSNAQAKDQQRQKAQLKQLLAGAKVHLTGQERFLIAGRTLSGAQLVAELEALLQPHLQLDEAVQQARVLLSGARANVRKTLGAGRALLNGARAALLVQFGKGNPLLPAFGVPTGVRRAPSVATKLQAAINRRLTRQERHTMGKRQRQAIKGARVTVQLQGPTGKPLAGPKKRRK